MSRSLGLREDQQEGAQLVVRINALFPVARELFVAREIAVARELAPAGVRSAPRIFGAAAHPSGSKLPHHKITFAAGQAGGWVWSIDGR